MFSGTLISSSSVFSKISLNVWKFTVHVLLKTGLENFEHYFTNVWDECKIIADGDCSHEIKRRLLFGRKVMTNLDSIFKSRDITLLTKVRLVKVMVFPVVMYGYVFGLWRRLSAEELMLLNCGVGESLGLQGDPTSPFWRRSTLGFLWKEWC